MENVFVCRSYLASIEVGLRMDTEVEIGSGSRLDQA